MAVSLEHLLPDPDQAPRCAEHARSISVDPGGTAIRADRIVVVEAPLPWPKPALDHPRLIDLARALQSAPRSATLPTRVLAAEPRNPGPPTIDVFDRDGPSVRRRRYRADTTRELRQLTDSLTADDATRADPLLLSDDAEPQVVLLCTQGSHDVCCGSEGMRLAAELEAAGHHDVYRVSHTGGHRFAPTGLTFPSGRMWQGLSADLLDQIQGRTGDPAVLAARCRGWWGAETGAAQVAERAVFAEVGWALDDVARTIEPAEPVAEGTGRDGLSFRVRSDAASWLVALSPGREVPTIACRAPGGLPAKPGQEYVVKSVEQA